MFPLAAVVIAFAGLVNSAAFFFAAEAPEVTTSAWINGGAAVTNLSVLVFTLRWFMTQAEAVRLQQKADADANRSLQQKLSDDSLKESRNVQRSLNKNTETLLLVVIEGRTSSQEAKRQAESIRDELKSMRPPDP